MRNLRLRISGGKHRTPPRRHGAARQRRPHNLDPVVLDGSTWRISAEVLAPAKGFWLRQLGATDARRDRFLSGAEWAGFRWHRGRHRWEAGPA